MERLDDEFRELVPGAPPATWRVGIAPYKGRLWINSADDDLDGVIVTSCKGFNVDRLIGGECDALSFAADFDAGTVMTVSVRSQGPKYKRVRAVFVRIP